MDVSALILDAVRREVSRQLRDVREVRWATVDTTSPLKVTFPGDDVSVPVSKVDGYSPSAGATCVLLRVGRRWWAIGEQG